MTGGAACLLAALALAGCTASGEFAPVAAYHSLEGGDIARPRPAPPNDTAPYPSLGTVPKLPTVMSADNRARIASALEADRAGGQYIARITPVAPAAATQRPYVLPQPGAAQADDSAMSAALPAAGATPSAAQAGTATVSADRRMAQSSADAPAPATPALPVIPAAPPPIPSIGGVPATIASPPPPPPPPVPKAAVVIPGAPVGIAFPVGSAALPPAALRDLRGLAARRGPGEIAIIGYGDAAAADPATQAAALPLAWSRAKVIRRALLAAGVPGSVLRVTAEATGHGGVARIVS